MMKKFPLLSRFMLFIVLPLMIPLFYGYHYMRQSLPLYEGEIAIPELQTDVSISFDQFGVPTVAAENDNDAFFAQGYLHASERMWQMELQRRFMQGKLSEVFGASTISTDIWMRTLGFPELAIKSYDRMNQRTKMALDSYAKGVNSWLKNNKVLPPEFIIFGIDPEPWEIKDSLAWQKSLALNLGKNMYDEVRRINALKVLSPKQLKLFYPYDPEIKNITSDEVVLSDRQDQSGKLLKDKNNNPNESLLLGWENMEKKLQIDWSMGERFVGSNAWAVSGKHTKSGSPILANDPHLTLQFPSIWYAIQLKGHELDVSGMSIVGLPGVILGKNNKLAWGVTSLISDQQDLFELDVSLKNNLSYEAVNSLEPIEVRDEVIRIRPEKPEFLNKKNKDITVRVRKTALGPIITDAIYESQNTMALRWVALDEFDNSFESIFNLQYAQNWQEFRSALRQHKAPGLHFLYADSLGNIGSQVAGAFPVRGAGTGIIPQKAYSPTNHWQGYVEFDELPMQYNPQSGFLVSANNQIKASFDISHEWAPMTRNKRINQLLSSYIERETLLDSNIMHNIQLDTVDLGARKLLPLLQNSHLQKNIIDNMPDKLVEIAQSSLNEINNWDGNYSALSSAASVYHYWIEELKLQIFSDDLNPAWAQLNEFDFADGLIEMLDEDKLYDVLKDQDNLWCVKNSESTKTCQYELLSSFILALEKLEKYTESSDVTDDWHWQNVHYVEYGHEQLGKLRFFDSFFNQKVGVAGSNNSINVGSTMKTIEENYQQTFGSTFRQVFDLSENQHWSFLLSSGQSGHFLSDHYDDMIQPFLDPSHGLLNYINGQVTNDDASSGEDIKTSLLKLKSRNK